MGYGTDFKCNIYLNRIVVDSKWQLEELIKDRTLMLEDIKNKILMFASANPKDLVPKDWKEEPINFIHNAVRELLRDYDENNTELVNFMHCLDSYDTKESDA